MLYIFKKKYLIDYLGGFTDIHNHLLPGIDDGVNNSKHGIYIIKQLAEYGIENHIFTPHVMGDIYPNSSAKIENTLKNFKTQLNKQKLDNIHIKAAAEYMIDPYFDELIEKKDILTVHNNFVLIELSYFQAPINLENSVYKIINSGYQPILAHPERYIFFHTNFSKYKLLKDMGCYFQINALSLSNYYGASVKKTALNLMENKMIDFLGTDIHHSHHSRKLVNITLSKKTVELLLPVIRNNKEVFAF
ncbi:tyrosine-protein phosphatase [Abyssalbus ytuae]|uniref:protein-tyrosine-phosphatase n=1 Tax=Abyssalbus ytuae TaxID=2926907 RepID=A0A9E6ZK20_9FLAO|nr:CpsB/CapC family capsule biosynthesis tyrosine phosphatase [Abyssalbus ytuae]UOB17087.1 histidinol phosphatase [Abyssalbus ytuae]